MKVFIAGVMQGTRKDKKIQSQDYRKIIKNALLSWNNKAQIIDPDETDPDRLNYDNDQAAEMFFRYCDVAEECDLLIAYLPEPSMGSAIEMWKAYRANIPVVSISPLKHNWVIKLLSKRIYPSLESFCSSVKEDGLKLV